MNNKNAVITGGTKGLGKATLLKLLDSGFNVATISRDSQSMRELEELTDKKDNKVLIFQGDLTKQKSVDDFCEKVLAEFESIDLIFNNAGYNIYGSNLEKIDLSSVRDIIEIHTIAPLNIFQHLFKQMSANSIIINIISKVVKGYIKEEYGPYTISKFAEYGFGQSLAKELSKKNIHVTNVILGGVQTEIRKDERPDYLTAEEAATAILKVIEMPNNVFVPEITIYPKTHI